MRGRPLGVGNWLMVKTSQICVGRNPGILWPVAGAIVTLGTREMVSVGTLTPDAPYSVAVFSEFLVESGIIDVGCDIIAILSDSTTHACVPGKLSAVSSSEGEMSYMHSLNRLPVMNTKNLCPAA